MDLPHIVSATLGLSSPWRVSSVALDADGQRLDITVTYDSDQVACCPRCGAKGVRCDVERETWYHHDFFRYATYLHTRVPRLTCCGQYRTVERPWARSGSKFVKIQPEASDGKNS
jgi:transposase